MELQNLKNAFKYVRTVPLHILCEVVQFLMVKMVLSLTSQY